MSPEKGLRNENHTKSVALMTRHVWTSVATLLLRKSTRFHDEKCRFTKKENTRSQIYDRFVRLQQNWYCIYEQACVSNIVCLLVSDGIDHRTPTNTQTHANNYSFTPYNLTWWSATPSHNMVNYHKEKTNHTSTPFLWEIRCGLKCEI